MVIWTLVPELLIVGDVQAHICANFSGICAKFGFLNAKQSYFKFYIFYDIIAHDSAEQIWSESSVCPKLLTFNRSDGFLSINVSKKQKNKQEVYCRSYIKQGNAKFDRYSPELMFQVEMLSGTVNI